MKTRIIAGAVLVLLLVVCLFWLPLIFTAIVFALLSALAAYELLWSTGLCREPRLVVYSMVMAAVIPIFYYFAVHNGIVNSSAYVLLGILAFMVLMFGEMMASHVRLQFEKIAYCFVAGLLLPFLFASLIRIHASYCGRYLVVIPFVIAFASDSGAYFAGRFFGKTKLAPVISPKKTVEGMVGGMISAVVFLLIYCLIMRYGFDFKPNYGFAVVYGIVGSAAGVFGDLCFSVIKRQPGIKDYGKLIPGHGGALDRFDSMMLVAPLTEALLAIFPLLQITEIIW